MTAENDADVASAAVVGRASMRPRPMTAENAVDTWTPTRPPNRLQ